MWWVLKGLKHLLLENGKIHLGGDIQIESDGREKDKHMVGRHWRQGLVAVITGVWVVQFIAMLGFKFQPDSTVNAAFLLVAGAVFGVEAIRSGRGGNGGGESGTP